MPNLSPTADICTRVERLRTEFAGPRGKASFARQLGLSPSTYDYYEKSRVPPADVLVQIADLTSADLRWLLTGKESTSPVPASHPALQRAARLLADHPHAARPLAAFVDMLAEAMEKFPDRVGGPSAKTEDAAKRPAPARTPESPQVDAAGQPVGNAGWIPVLGRSAAGIPAFWTGEQDEQAVTNLADLVAGMGDIPAQQIQPAVASDDQHAGEQAVQLVTFDSPRPPGTAEFVIAEDLVALYARAFAVRIDGESMAPAILHGDLVVLSPDFPAEQGKPAVVQLAGQIGVTCKLFRRDEQNVHLIPINERFAPHSYPADHLQWALRVLARIRPSPAR